MDKINKKLFAVAFGGKMNLLVEIQIAMLENSNDLKKALVKVAKRLFNEVVKGMNLTKEEKLRAKYRVQQVVKEYAKRHYYGV